MASWRAKWCAPQHASIARELRESAGTYARDLHKDPAKKVQAKAADESPGAATEVEHTHVAALPRIAVPADRTDGAVDEVQRGSARGIRGHRGGLRALPNR